MKKKLMMIAVLLGALSLGACVDDNESASVTDLRGAKAEQLRALATLSEAQAAAETARANAEAALKEAQARYWDALTAGQEQKNQQAAEEFALEIQEAQLRLQLTLLQIQQEIEAVEQTITENQNTYLTTRFTTYKTEMNKLLKLNRDLMQAKADIAYWNAGVEYAKANAEVQIRNQRQNIAGYEAQLEVLNDPAYTNINDEELWAQYQAAYKKYDLAYDNLCNNEGAALKAAGDAVKVAYEAQNDAMKAVSTVNTIYNVVLSNTEGLTYATDIYGSYATISVYKDFRIDNVVKLSADNAYAADVKSKADALGQPSDTKDKTTAWGKLAKANADLDAANALPDTDTGKAAAIAAAKAAVAQARNDRDVAQIAYDDAVEAQKEFNDAFAAIDIDALNKTYDAIKEKDALEEDALDAYYEASSVSTELYAESQALYALYIRATNIEEQKAQLQANIESAEQTIAWYENTYVTESEVALQQANDKVTKLTEQIEIQTEIVNAAKAALDAAVEAYGAEDTTPEEPSDEPTEEQPSEEQPSEEQPAA